AGPAGFTPAPAPPGEDPTQVVAGPYTMPAPPAAPSPYAPTSAPPSAPAVPGQPAGPSLTKGDAGAESTQAVATGEDDLSQRTQLINPASQQPSAGSPPPAAAVGDEPTQRYQP
ncbi:hypothetical protein AAFH96_36750, partial [Polymorphospora sp. 2-325]